MITVHKYEIQPERPTKMPRDAKVLHVGTQIPLGRAEGIFVWALVETNNDMVDRYLAVVGTGHVLDERASIEKHVGSVSFQTATLVFHVFDFGETFA